MRKVNDMSEEKTVITLQDIALMVSIIDATVKRGAIEGSEMSLVGGIRDKLDKFVKENTPKSEETNEEDTE
jgi:hypothetical protein